MNVKIVNKKAYSRKKLMKLFEEKYSVKLLENRFE